MTNEHAGLTREHDAGITRGNHTGTTSGTYIRTTSETHTGTVGGNHTETTSGTRAGMTRGNDAEPTSGTLTRATSDTSTETTSGPHIEMTSGTHAGMTRGNDAEMATGTHSRRTSGPSADVFSAGALYTETSAGTAMSETTARTTTSETSTQATTSGSGTRATTSATSTQATTSETGRTAATAAAAALIQAARTETADRFLPVTPVSLAALLCLSMGEPRRALDALRGGPSVAVRGNGSSAGGHLLVLSAWVAMLGGDEQEAAACVGAVHQDALPTRDRLLAHGVAVGLARRSGDHSALTLAWQAAAPLFDDVGVDLLTLLPIGELWLAGIRLRDEGRIAGLVDAARELLRRLHNPPAWANAFHWYALQAAIAHERPDELLSPARQLKAAAAAGDPHAAVLADAGRTWVLVLRGQVEPEEVSAAVRRLAGIGLSWDAARLASEAALAAGDSATATVLLKLARTVRAEARPSPRAARPADPAEPAPPKPAPVVDAVLSEREREVAELVLLGLTYREIGARLYISSKTVEHHVARIRRRIGAGSRSELLSMLRAMGHGSLLV
ncbi:hypothetical protein CRH09_38105 [Nocardia terpenica]|uniref:HTH luxR-type domain-containing protein n=2 Tax=Nocardia terpenica TaxID=455432 RepID=A0A291RY16_9NOCA|nr:hypothetical protein CRH09_38105 [Nocardia terpenica]